MTYPNRRETLRALSLATAASAIPRFAFAQRASANKPLALRDTAWAVRLSDGSNAPAQACALERRWTGDVCRSRLKNTGPKPLAIKEIVLCAVPHGFAADAVLYGESFQMLSQTYGTLGQPVKLGFDEAKHYRLPEVAGAVTVRSFAMLSPGGKAPRHLVGFSSCRRFSGEIRIFPDRLEVVLDTEGRSLAPDATWDLEDLVHFEGTQREPLLSRLASALEKSHARLPFPKIPTGWCSWYYYGKGVTEEDILQNLDAIARDAKNGFDLRYIQIDDGYQPAHGDWLDPNPKGFPSGIKSLCGKIREKGFEPAIWVAPFIASPRSRLLREHPDWFVKGPDGKPLSADKVTFQGWNDAPWFMLDATIPAVQAHLEQIFRVMREDWGCTYFKLDANFWGAVHGSRYADKDATRIENYRRGMAAVIRGAGRDSFILGCNAPMWASIGVVHGMRTTGDIKREWSRFARCAREQFHRNWQHGRLWMNDPDCIVVSTRVKPRPATATTASPAAASPTDDEMMFHATAIVASGGMLLNGDDYTGLTPAQKAILKKSLPPTGHPARFESDDFLEGRADLQDGRTLVFVFNWDDAPRTHVVKLDRARHLRDFWDDTDLGTHATYEMTLPPHGARLLVATRR
jgi:alpha-galactosidase